MEYKAKIFEHKKFGKIRVVNIEGEPWFVGIDVTCALGYSNARDALDSHVPDKHKRVITRKQWEQMASNQDSRETRLSKTASNQDSRETRLSKTASNQDSRETVSIFSQQTMGGAQRLTFINEAGLYKLVLRSKLPAAEEFSDWVCEEVLPSIRKYGYYSLVQPAPVVAKPVRVPNPNRVAAQLADASIYVIRVGDEYVKIGNSKNVEERKASLKSWRGLPFGEDYKTVRFPRTIARKIESACQKMFSQYHVEGEIFHVNYETACLSLKVLEQLVETLPLVSNPKFGDKKLV